MTEIYIAYKSISFPDLGPKEDPTLNRVSKSMLIQRMEAEANASFLKKAIISPFEEALLTSDRDEFDTGEFEIDISDSTSPPKTSWAKIHSRLSEFLDVRADDSRAKEFPGMKYFEGVGYCLKVEALQKHLEKLIGEETSKPPSSRSLTWPKKERDEAYPTEIVLPNTTYKRVTRENGVNVLQAKRFVSGVAPNVVNPYQTELQRWFEVNTGYNPPEKIPDETLGHDERIIEFARGSYGRVQLVREETPKYQKIIASIQVALGDMKKNLTVQEIRSTQDDSGVPYINIKSIRDSLKPESLKERDLIKIGHRYNITP